MSTTIRIVPVVLALGLGAVGCMPPGQRGGAAPGVQTGGLVKPGAGPAPSSPDATMPASLPPPAAPTTLAQRNPLFNTGSTLTGVGAGLVLGGVLFVTLGTVLPCKDSGCKSASEAKSDKALGDAFIGGGAALFIGGGVLLAVGIPLWIAGYNQITHQVETAGATGVFITRDGFGVRF